MKKGTWFLRLYSPLPMFHVLQDHWAFWSSVFSARNVILSFSFMGEFPCQFQDSVPALLPYHTPTDVCAPTVHPSSGLQSLCSLSQLKGTLKAGQGHMSLANPWAQVPVCIHPQEGALSQNSPKLTPFLCTCHFPRSQAVRFCLFFYLYTHPTHTLSLTFFPLKDRKHHSFRLSTGTISYLNPKFLSSCLSC